MPQLHERQDIGRLIREMVLLYQEAHKHLTINCNIDETLPEFLTMRCRSNGC